MKARILIPFFVICISGLSIILHSIAPFIEDYTVNRGHSWEDYDSSYFNKFQSVQSIIDTVDRQFPDSAQQSLAYFNQVATIVRKRFFHGYSYYYIKDNAMASISGLAWNHLSAIVIPDDIMKHPRAACSQQAIVMMEIFKRKGVAYRKVGLTNHFAVEARIRGSWRFFDTNLEPDLRDRRESFESLARSGRLQTIYRRANLDTALIKDWRSVKFFGKENAPPAPNATLYHKAGFLLQSKYFLLILLFIQVINTFPYRWLRRKLAHQSPADGRS